MNKITLLLTKQKDLYPETLVYLVYLEQIKNRHNVQGIDFYKHPGALNAGCHSFIDYYQL